MSTSVIHTDAIIPREDPNDTQEFIIEAVNAEIQLWTLIHSNGPLDPGVQELYRKARSSYESAILNDHDFAKLHDIEHAMWRLHYKHIDEFRSRMPADSADTEFTVDFAIPPEAADNFLEGFRTFLSGATQFYHELITKIRECYGVPMEVLTVKKVSFSNCMESTKMQKIQFLCHRCLVCLGDLARYDVMYGNHDSKNCNWSAAATHYLNASILWPDSGNPQNQNRSSHLPSLYSEATLNFFKPSERTVVKKKAKPGDCYSNCNMLEAIEGVVSSEETCLWHLIVQMISIFYIKSSSEDFTFTFASTISELDTLLSHDDSKLKAVLESYQHMRSNAVRASDFRVLQFVCALIFTLHTLGKSQKIERPKSMENMEQPALIELALTATFICMGRLVHRCGITHPVYHSPLLPAILVFVEWLACWPDILAIDKVHEKSTSALNYFFGVFVEFLNKFGDNEENSNKSVGATELPDYTALWEDRQLRGFTPLSPVHESLCFMYDNGNKKEFEKKHENRVRIHRILLAAMRMVNWSSRPHKWILYEKSKNKFHTIELMKSNNRESETMETTVDLETSELHRPPLCNTVVPVCGSAEEIGLQVDENAYMLVKLDVHRNSIDVEEDEIIVFKPIIRNNSVPFHVSSNTTPQVLIEGMRDQLAAAGECVPRASSLPIGRTQVSNDSLSFHSTATDFNRNTIPCSDSSTQFCMNGLATDQSRLGIGEYGTDSLLSAPSLSTWALKQENLGIAKQCMTDFGGHGWGGIEDISCGYLGNLSINRTSEKQSDRNVLPSTAYCNYDPLCNSPATPYYSPPYVAPLPSAPLLPIDEISCSGDSSSGYARYKDDPDHLRQDTAILTQQDSNNTKGRSNFIGASLPVNDYFRTPGPSGCDPSHQEYNKSAALLPSARAEGAPWPHRYWDNPYQDQLNNRIWLDKFYSPTHLGRFQDFDFSRLSAYDRWQMNYSVGLPPPMHFPYGVDVERERRERFVYGDYQRISPYGYSGVIEQTYHQQQQQQLLLLQYLKEQELCMQHQQSQRSSN
ncbi:telomerase activating protein Est1 isoform X2 [Tasmannia lanceolata]|uniref:telomerase activating protein Est1 isoform X2 n=1 Tax=Tasmannia lanceolata TaxID=3420 RepID=UPI0040645155